MDIGDIIFLPTTIDVKSRSTKHENENLCNEGMKFIRGLELFKVLISVNCFSSICCQMLKFLQIVLQLFGKSNFLAHRPGFSNNCDQ